MNYVVDTLAIIGLMGLGFQIGSIVEYNKKYNATDKEIELYRETSTAVHNLLANLLYHVQSTLHIGNHNRTATGAVNAQVPVQA